MRTYSLKSMPLEVAPGILGHPLDCEHCGKRYMVEAQYVIQCQVVPLSEEDDFSA